MSDPRDMRRMPGDPLYTPPDAPLPGDPLAATGSTTPYDATDRGGSSWGWIIGTVVVALLLIFAFTRDWKSDTASNQPTTATAQRQVPPAAPDRGTTPPAAPTR
jgi:hypothetical protein